MNILITGGFGYIGSATIDYLLKQTDDNLTIIDRLDYATNKDFFYSTIYNKRIKFIRGDIQHLENIHPLIKNCDVVIHLAAIVGESACSNKPEQALMINQLATCMIADLCKKYRKKLIFLSTCSNYGKTEKPVDEKGQLTPISIYAITKVEAENYIENIIKLPEATILRCATAYGFTEGRMRFDLLLHEFIKDGFTGTIKLYNSNAVRPLCHVKDIAHAIRLAIDDVVAIPTIYNIGSNEQNFTKLEIAKLVAKRMNAEIQNIESFDKRDYTVNFNKAKDILKFKPQHNIKKSIDTIATKLEHGDFQEFYTNG